MATRPSANDLRRYWGLAEMQTERVWFRQTYIDPKAGPEGRPLCSAIIALVTNDAAISQYVTSMRKYASWSEPGGQSAWYSSSVVAVNELENHARARLIWSSRRSSNSRRIRLASS